MLTAIVVVIFFVETAVAAVAQSGPALLWPPAISAVSLYPGCFGPGIAARLVSRLPAARLVSRLPAARLVSRLCVASGCIGWWGWGHRRVVGLCQAVLENDMVQMSIGYANLGILHRRLRQ